MGLLAWYIGIALLGAVAGLYAAYWAGIGLMVVLGFLYFSAPPSFRSVVTELHAVLGLILMLIMSWASPVLYTLAVA